MKLSLGQTLLLAALSSSSLTALAHPNSIGYAYDERGVIARDGYGNCVRTAEWAKENAVKECDPALFPAPVAVKPAPVVVAPAPAPAPMPVKIELSADNSFDTGKSTLKPEGQAVLDKLAADLNGVTFDKLTIVGHADRRGSKASNQKLSEDRANSVKAYLASKGVDGGKMSASGMGSSEPVTAAGDCKKLKGAKLATCLSPDRRVSIRVSGTKLK
ncbi:Outer membrane protein P5 [Ferriphaselus amnicola]|uniref:Outer membrane protein P5 n=1 Tax=Ferriphaselus amnicola TaxID=1188319 RepID=A0A2Z6GBC0_9PROT|nr:OmpA family protein [Ferriphaselus amnicola]BBE50788.1 Outer membrane protein P5 [Ferriphaselus amnicola]